MTSKIDAFGCFSQPSRWEHAPLSDSSATPSAQMQQCLSPALAALRPATRRTGGDSVGAAARHRRGPTVRQRGWQADAGQGGRPAGGPHPSAAGRRHGRRTTCPRTQTSRPTSAAGGAAHAPVFGYQQGRYDKSAEALRWSCGWSRRWPTSPPAARAKRGSETRLPRLTLGPLPGYARARPTWLPRMPSLARGRLRAGERAAPVGGAKREPPTLVVDRSPDRAIVPLQPLQHAQAPELAAPTNRAATSDRATTPEASSPRPRGHGRDRLGCGGSSISGPMASPGGWTVSAGNDHRPTEERQLPCRRYRLTGKRPRPW
jgi:hypothetical protein